MFDISATPRVFSLPLGCDFSVAFLDGLKARMRDQSPEAMARVEIYVNTRRTQRRFQDLLIQSGAGFLPRILLLTDLANATDAPISLPDPVHPLRRRLQLGQLVSAFIASGRTTAPKAAIYDLADSLAALMDEMQGEAVAFEDLKSIDLQDQSDHWQHSLDFLKIIAEHWDEHALKDPNDRMRQVAQAYANHWADNPPDHPILIAGSTGSRGHTALFMKAVANLPQGAVILPGVDQFTDDNVWEKLASGKLLMDHPQAGFAKLLGMIGLDRADMKPWSNPVIACPERSKLFSLALRPAPVTDQWRTEGEKLASTLAIATDDIDMIEAASPKEEALAIAVRLRRAAEDDVRSVLISPDRNLTRRVQAALKRWGIEADDSAGRPLSLTPSGIFLRLVANSMATELTPETFITLLKHPLCHGPKQARGDHLLRTRDLELQVLRGGAPKVDFDQILEWAQKREKDPNGVSWVLWLKAIFGSLILSHDRSLVDWVSLHKKTAQALSSQPNVDTESELWSKEEGEEALRVFSSLESEAHVGGTLSIQDYRNLVSLVIASGEVRSPRTHSRISIWGTLEARVQGADLVILGGLNEGIWPKRPSPDPWLNRTMRQQIGLPLPDRQLGLSAHDFQQAAAAPKLVLSRAIRDSEAPTISSRWMMRLTNLINGLGDEAKSLRKDMKHRGDHWIGLANQLDIPINIVAREDRPSPAPPVSARPKKLSVTQIKTLVTDPYQIYAREVLKLRKLRDFGTEPDPMNRGIVFHSFLETFISSSLDDPGTLTSDNFVRIAAEVLNRDAPWPAARRLWLARLAQIADWFVTGEIQRQSEGTILAQERVGRLYDKELDFTLTVKADRIDMDVGGNLSIFDYKAGSPPPPKDIRESNKQLELEAAIAQSGGFDDLTAAKINRLEYIGLHRDEVVRGHNPTAEEIDQLWQEFRELIARYTDPNKGFTSRDKSMNIDNKSDYDHLSRFGEWDLSDDPKPKVVP